MAPDGHEDLDSSSIIGYSIAVVLAIAGSGLMSGLTLGYLSLDELDLEVLKRTGTDKQRRQAARVLPLIKHPHWLLCTLVLCNAGCMETLPIFLDRLLDPIAAILLSVTAILLFGEIMPQAVCNKHGVAIGAFCAPVATLLLWLCSPISWPLGKLLDWVLGHDKPVFKRKELKAMIDLHGETAGMGGTLTVDEVNVISGALELTTKTARRSMTPISKVFMISDERMLDDALVAQLLQMGHSRVPVYRGDDRDDIIGLILVKELLQFWRCQEVPQVKDIRMRPLPKIPVDTPMFDVLNLFQTGRSHMVVCMGGAPPAPSIPDASNHGSNYLGPIAPHLAPGVPPGAPAHPSHTSVTVHDNAVASELLHEHAAAAADVEANGLSHELGRAGSAAAAGGEASPLAREHSGSFFGRLVRSGVELGKRSMRRRSSGEGQELALERSTSQLLDGDELPSDAYAPQQPPEPPGPPRPLGILTLEDVIEELMQEEIVDETDKFIDNEKTERVDMKALVQELSPRVRKLLQAHVIEAAQLLARHSNPRPQEPLGAAARALGQQLLPGDAGRLVGAAGRPHRVTMQDGLLPGGVDGVVAARASKRELRKAASFGTNLDQARRTGDSIGTTVHHPAPHAASTGELLSLLPVSAGSSMPVSAGSSMHGGTGAPEARGHDAGVLQMALLIGGVAQGPDAAVLPTAPLIGEGAEAVQQQRTAGLDSGGSGLGPGVGGAGAAETEPS